MHNISKIEKFIRFFVGVALVFTSNGTFSLMAFMGVFILFTALFEYCPLYHLLKINCEITQKHNFLTTLPKKNPEPIFVFSKNGIIIYQNDSSKNILPNIRNFKDISEHSPKEIIKNDATLTTKLKHQKETYVVEIMGISKEDYILTYGFNATDIENSKKQLQEQIITDYLTQLGNGGKLVEDFLKNKDKRQVLIELDIVKFSQINSFFSPEKANELLIVFSKTLQSLKKDFPSIFDFYRLRGNTFAILVLFDDTKEDTYSKEISKLQRKIFKMFEENKLQVDDIKVNINLRMGIASNSDFITSDKTRLALLEYADMALSEAKNKSLHVIYYNQIKELKQKYKENLDWANKLHDIALNQSEARFTTLFQPIYNLKTKKIEKFESLVRIEEKDKLIAPFFFLNIAKQTNMLTKITQSVLIQACEKFANTPYEFSINITSQDFLQKSFVKNILTTISKYDIKSSRVVLEILEDEDMYAYADIIAELKQNGFKIAIDDFGTGYSNFQKLQQLNADYIKIDGSLVKNIATNPRDLSIITSICTYAKTIGVKTIAEFVADKEIFDLIKESGVDYAQGYFISAPSLDTDIDFNA